jgi:hypothetical protein
MAWTSALSLLAKIFPEPGGSPVAVGPARKFSVLASWRAGRRVGGRGRHVRGAARRKRAVGVCEVYYTTGVLNIPNVYWWNSGP